MADGEDKRFTEKLKINNLWTDIKADFKEIDYGGVDSFNMS